MSRLRWRRFALVLIASGLLFVGCADGGVISALMVMVMMGAGLIACVGERADGTSDTRRDDATSNDDDACIACADIGATDSAVPSDSDARGELIDGCDGEWWDGCSDGQVVPMCCPTGWACNYYWWTPCNGGCVPWGQTCVSETDGDDGDGDAPSDADACDGTWEPVCDAGTIVTVCCPAGTACDPNELVDCGDGTCVESPARCP